MMIQFAVIFIVAIVAFILSAICGGGASFLLIPLLGWVLPAAQVPAALSLGTATSSISRMLIFFKNIRWDIVVWFLPLALPAVYLGARLLSIVDPVLMEFVIGIFLLSNLPFLFRPQKNVRPGAKGSKFMLLIIGMGTGFLSGLTGAVGLLFNRFYLTYGMTNEEIVATRAANELLLHLLKIVLYTLFGLLSTKALGAGFMIAVAAVLSGYLLKYVIPLISIRIYQKIGFFAMVLSGAVMFINSLITFKQDDQIQLSIQKEQHEIYTKVKWKQTTFSPEFAFNNGVEIERQISLQELPMKHQALVKELSKNSDYIMIEEVYQLRHHYFEIYVYKGAVLSKYYIR